MLSSLVGLSIILVPVASAQKTLDALAKSRGLKYFGTATDGPLNFPDEPYTEILFSSGEFGQITAANAMKWGLTEVSRGVYNYTDADEVYDRATAAGQIVRGHALAWHNQMPEYVANLTDPTELMDVLSAHITDEVTHYKGKLYCWDVVNEIFDDEGNMRSTQYYDTVGESYIADAFTIARAADPDVKLYVNDYNLESPGVKWELAVSKVAEWVKAGVPIDGVGFQGHLIVGSLPSLEDIVKALTGFTDLGLEVSITELDIRFVLPATDEILAQQKADYHTVVEACLAVTGCVGLTVWDYTDKYSWIPGWFEGEGGALPWDENLEKKPAYYGIAEALEES